MKTAPLVRTAAAAAAVEEEAVSVGAAAAGSARSGPRRRCGCHPCCSAVIGFRGKRVVEGAEDTLLLRAGATRERIFAGQGSLLGEPCLSVLSVGLSSLLRH